MAAYLIPHVRAKSTNFHHLSSVSVPANVTEDSLSGLSRHLSLGGCSCYRVLTIRTVCCRLCSSTAFSASSALFSRFAATIESSWTFSDTLARSAGVCACFSTASALATRAASAAAAETSSAAPTEAACRQSRVQARNRDLLSLSPHTRVIWNTSPHILGMCTMGVSRKRKWLFSGKIVGNIDGAASNHVSESVSHRVPGKLTCMVRAGVNSGDVRCACEQCDPTSLQVFERQFTPEYTSYSCCSRTVILLSTSLAAVDHSPYQDLYPPKLMLS